MRPDEAAGCILLSGCAGLLFVVVLLLIDYRLALLWLIVGGIGVVVLDTAAGPPSDP